jgi:uncharacterized protein
MDWIFAIPAFVKVGSSFAGILLCNRLGVPLGVAILLFSVVLSLWSRTGLSGLLHQIYAFARPENWMLPVVIFLLLLLTEGLNRSGRMKRTMDALKFWLKSKRMLLAGFPALVGLLPMPGGAIVSAPLVAEVDSDNELELAHKVAINYWYRHLWEYWWPLYPGVILAMSYSGLPVALFFAVQIPFSAAMMLGGYLFILKKIPAAEKTRIRLADLNLGDVGAAMVPIMVLVVASLVGSAVLPRFGMDENLSSLAAMFAGLLFAMAMVFFRSPSSFAESLWLFRDKATGLMMVLVVAIQMFSGVLTYPLDPAGHTIVTAMRDEFLRAGIPILSLVMLVPFISGAVTGVAFGFVGASFPIVFALVGSDLSTAAAAATTALAYGFGYMGMMMSPMHVCLVVSGEYFRCSLYGAYRYIVGPAGVILLAALFLSGFYYLVL